MHDDDHRKRTEEKVPDEGALVAALVGLAVESDGGLGRAVAALARRELEAVVQRLIMERLIAAEVAELRRAL